MIVFITSIRHPRNCHSIDKVYNLLQHTLESITNQKSDDFAVVVVVNELPHLSISDTRINYVKVDFPPPSILKRPETGWDAVLLDKGCKYFIGLLYASRFKPDYVMFIDADDFISNRIADFVNKQKDSSGWYIKDGYTYASGANTLGVLENFNMACGTSYIIKYSLLDVPNNIPLNASQQAIVQVMGDFYILHVLGGHGHKNIQSFISNKASPLEPLPFPGAVYHQCHGESHSGFWQVNTDKELPITKDIICEYKLPLIAKSRFSLFALFCLRVRLKYHKLKDKYRLFLRKYK